MVQGGSHLPEDGLLEELCAGVQEAVGHAVGGQRPGSEEALDGGQRPRGGGLGEVIILPQIKKN